MKTLRPRYDREIRRVLKAMKILEGLIVDHVVNGAHALPEAVYEEVDAAHKGLGRGLRRLKGAKEQEAR